MARRSDHSREELYELAMNAARRIVEADGFRALTARSVADAIGYSPGTLYNLFENLDEMTLHLNGRTLDALHDRLADVECVGEPEVDVKKLLASYLKFLNLHPRLWGVLFEYSLPEGADVPAWYLQKVARVMGVVEDALAPLFENDDTTGRADAARTLWASLHGICSLSQAGKLQVVTPQTVKQMAESLTENYIAGLRAGSDVAI